MRREYESPKAELTKFDVIDITTMDPSIPPVNGSNEGNVPGGGNNTGFDSEVW